jgi:hypothetical protein
MDEIGWLMQIKGDLCPNLMGSNHGQALGHSAGSLQELTFTASH